MSNLSTNLDINPLHPLSLRKPFRSSTGISKNNFLKLLPTSRTTSYSSPSNSSNATNEYDDGNDYNDELISYHKHCSLLVLPGETLRNDDGYDEIHSEQESGTGYRKDKFFLRLKSSIKKYLGVGKERKRHQEAHHQD
ncbi:14634_t:CDS:1, partial [Funneliformis caledonium]